MSVVVRRSVRGWAATINRERVYDGVFFLSLLLSSFWISRGHRCRPFFTPGSCLQFLLRTGFSNPAGRRFFIECMYDVASALTSIMVRDNGKIVRNRVT